MSRGASILGGDALPFFKLTEVLLSPRVRSLLDGIYQTTWTLVAAALERALDDLDGNLLSHAERAPNAGEQESSLQSLREIRRHRAEFLRAVRDAVQRSILALVDGGIPVESLRRSKAATGAAQSVAPTPADLEQDAALSEMASRAEIRAAVALQALGFRLGVIACAAPIDLHVLAVGPQRLCAAIRVGLRGFEINPLHRLALCRRVDKALFLDPASFYDTINRFLIEHRVYANLQPLPRTASHELVPRAEVAQPALQPNAVAAPVPAPPLPEPGPKEASADSPAARAFQRLNESVSTESVRVATVANRSGSNAPLDAKFFAELRALIASRRGTGTAGLDSELTRASASNDELQTVLRVLQAQPAAPVMVGGKWLNRGMTHIKQDMLNHLRSLRHGEALKLGDDDAVVLDLLAALFEHMLAPYRPNSMVHGILSRLQIPVLRAALLDQSFFIRHSHPARQLLNLIAETFACWVEDEDADRQLIESAQFVVERLNRDFDTDFAVYHRHFEEFSKHIAGLQKKADVAERRHVEAAKGREKLELARAAAHEAVQQRLQAANLPAAVRDLTENAWTDAVALSLLRQGIEHPKTGERIALVQQLVAAYAPGLSSEACLQRLETIHGLLEEGLMAIGFHEDAVSKVWADLINLSDAGQGHDRLVASAAISELIKQKPRFGVDSLGAGSLAADEASRRGGERVALGPREQAHAEQIKRLPFGTWFEFVGPSAMVRRKLSWFSPVTGRCLFLSVRGAKGDEYMIEQLARDLQRGAVRMVETIGDNVIDRAFRNIMMTSKGQGASDREPGARPA